MLFEICEEFLRLTVPGGDNFDFDNVVDIFNAAVFPPSLIRRGERTNGNGAEVFQKLFLNLTNSPSFDSPAVIIF